LESTSTSGQCPKCSRALELRQRRGVPIGSCPGCRGVWLSSSALIHLLEQRGAVEAAGSVYQLDQLFKQASSFGCPGCQQPLAQTWLAEVEIEYCPQCHGIFFDKGELRRVATREDELRPRAEPFESGGALGLVGDVLIDIALDDLF
jgi:Zn-finger nucleic acid-binding protein